MRDPRAQHSQQVSILACFVLMAAGLCSGQVSVTTYHNDNYRTGWNKNESTLTPAKVGSTYFGLLKTIALDEQVDAQPLVVPGVSITAGSFQGIHDVVYVATENNTVYAIDVHSGTILLSSNLGPPVPKSVLLDGCNNNGPNVGITSTPVIDLTNKLLYVMAYTNDGPTYRIHALALGTLKDTVNTNGVVVSASHTLNNGTTFTFGAKYQRQRPALLLANGNVYAGFGSFCDYEAGSTRGWMVGWAQGTLAPLQHNQLLDTQATDSGSYFLTSIWMSGYGPAADDSGNVLFVTGNSDKNASTYDGITDIQESVVKVKFDLSTVVDHFTPSNEFSLDQQDTDFGAGGVLVLPDQSGTVPHLAVAAGKDGNMYFMNEDNLGGFSTTKNNVLGTYSIGACWCGQSYYVDPVDGLGRVVTSGGKGLGVWKLQTSPSPSLTNVAQLGAAADVQSPGFFTSISSNGTAGPVIWTLLRPFTSSSPPITLQAFDPDHGYLLLFSGTAGSWPNLTGNANLVPVVANGQVFVASNKQLQIFGVMSVANPSKLSNTTTQTAWNGPPPECQGAHYAYSNWQYRDTNGLHAFVGTSDTYAGNAFCTNHTDGFSSYSTDGQGYLLVANGGSGTITPPK